MYQDQLSLFTEERIIVPLTGEVKVVVREQSVREQAIAKSCTLTPSDDLHPNRWIEEKMIKRAGKLHGPYLYERWRDQETGKMKSKYLGKKPSSLE